MCSWMMSILLFLISLFMFHPSISATVPHCDPYVIDMFGDDSPLGHKILKKYQKEFIKIHLKRKRGENMKDTFLHRIKTEGDYLYVDHETMVYPGMTKACYVTLEVITKREPERLRWVQALQKPSEQPVQHDVVQQMKNYVETGMSLLMSNQLDPSTIKCKSYHCLCGFEHPQLKPYREQFDKGVRFDKAIILKALNSPDNSRREAAAFLVGEFSDPKEIIQRLLPHVSDKDSGVRNNVIRVIFDTMRHANIYDIDVHPFIQLLNSPYGTDRNKALFVLLQAMRNPKNKVIIKKEGLGLLQRINKLKQPNNHDVAHLILQQLS